MYMRYEAGDWTECKVREIVGFGRHASGCGCCEGKHVTCGEEGQRNEREISRELSLWR